MLPVQCAANTLFLTLEQVSGRINLLSVYRYIYIDRKAFLHEHFLPPQEVVSLLQQERNAKVQRAYKEFRVSIVLA